MSTPKIHVANDQSFQICPEWVLMAPISAQAIRLYLVLRKFGDNTTEESHWSRANIASAMQLKSTRSVDHYIKELVDLGALKVRPRFDGNRQTSNWYKVITADPGQYSARVAESCTPVVAEDCAPEGAESCSQSQNLDEPRTSTDSLFEEFWKAYPRPLRKKVAKTRWDAAIKRESPEVIIRAAEIYAQDCEVSRRETKYIKYPEGFLSSDMWEDYQTPVVTTISAKYDPWSKEAYSA